MNLPLVWIACRFVLLCTFLTGLCYPLLITGLAQLLSPWRANGSLLYDTYHQVRGSACLGQDFSADHYFWGRPSATKPVPYNALASSGSNAVISTPRYQRIIKARINKLQNTAKPIPVSLITASGSGLDPDISPEAAFYQVSRVARARHLAEAPLIRLIETHKISRSFGFLGEERLNVLMLNQDLDKLCDQSTRTDLRSQSQ